VPKREVDNCRGKIKKYALFLRRETLIVAGKWADNTAFPEGAIHFFSFFRGSHADPQFLGRGRLTTQIRLRDMQKT